MNPFNLILLLVVVSFRRSVSLSAAQRKAREKINKARYFSSRAVFRAAPQVTERLQEASLVGSAGHLAIHVH